MGNIERRLRPLVTGLLFVAYVGLCLWYGAQVFPR